MSTWIDQENGTAESRAKAREVQGGDGANTETNEVRLATPCVLSIPYLSRAAGHARPSGGGAVRGSRRRRGLTTEGRDLSGRPVERVRCRAAVRGGGRAAPRAVGVGVTRSREISFSGNGFQPGRLSVVSRYFPPTDVQFDLTRTAGHADTARRTSIVVSTSLTRTCDGREGMILLHHTPSMTHPRRPGVLRQFHCRCQVSSGVLRQFHCLVVVGFVLRALAGA